MTRSHATAWAAAWCFNTYRAIERRVLRHAAAVITLGEPVKQVVVAEKGVPAGTRERDLPGDRPGRVRSPRLACDDSRDRA